MRALICCSLTLLAAWAGGDICAPDALAWNMTLISVNVTYVLYSVWREKPVRVPPDLKELHRKLFVPLRVDNREFSQLVRCGQTRSLAATEMYAVEEVTPTEDRLSVLLTGK